MARALADGGCTCGQGNETAPPTPDDEGAAGRRLQQQSALPSFASDPAEYRCLDGWFGPECEFPCPGIDVVTGAGAVCGGLGSCTATVDDMVEESCVTMVPSPHSIYASTVASCEAVDLSGTDTTAHKAACEALQTTAIDPVGGNMCLYTYARGSCQCEGCSHPDALGVCVPDSLDTADNPDYCGSGDEVCQCGDDGSCELVCECPGALGPTNATAEVVGVAESCEIITYTNAGDAAACSGVDVSGNDDDADRAACEALQKPTTGGTMCAYTAAVTAVAPVAATGCGGCMCQNGGECHAFTKECVCPEESCVEAAAVSNATDAAAWYSPTLLTHCFLGHFSPVLRRLFSVLSRFPASWRQDGENGRKMA